MRHFLNTTCYKGYLKISPNLTSLFYKLAAKIVTFEGTQWCIYLTWESVGASWVTLKIHEIRFGWLAGQAAGATQTCMYSTKACRISPRKLLHNSLIFPTVKNNTVLNEYTPVIYANVNNFSTITSPQKKLNAVSYCDTPVIYANVNTFSTFTLPHNKNQRTLL